MEQQPEHSPGLEESINPLESGVQDTQSLVMVNCISVLGQGGLHGMLAPDQIVDMPGHGAGVSPGVQQIPELRSATEITLDHGNMLTVEPSMTEIFT